MPALPSFVKIGQVSGSALVASVDTLADTDTAPDAAFPAGSIFTFDPSIPYLRYGSQTPPQTLYLQSVKGVIRDDGSIGTPDGDDLYLVANIGQDDDEAGQRDWYWTVTPAINGMGVLPKFRLDVTAGGVAYLTSQEPVPASQTFSALKGDKGDKGDPGLNTPPAGTPDDYVAVSIGGLVSWRDPASMGLVGATVSVDSAAGTATIAQGTTSATVYEQAKTDELLGAKLAASEVGAASGVAPLGPDQKVPQGNLPVSVNDNGDGTFTVADADSSVSTYTQAELDSKLAATGSTLTSAGAPKIADYAAGVNEYVKTDNSTNNVKVTAPTATIGRKLDVHVVALAAPNATTIYAGDGQTFDDGSTTITLDREGMSATLEVVEAGVWSVKAVSTPPAALAVEFDAAGAAQAVSDSLSTQIQSLQRQVALTSTTITEKIAVKGELAVGFLDYLWIETGFASAACRAYVRQAPVGEDLIVDAKVNGSVVYTFTIPNGQTSSVDLASGLVFDDETLVELDARQVGSDVAGADILLIFSSQAGSQSAPTIGSDGNLVLTAQPGAAVASWTYQSSGDNDVLDHHAVRWTTDPTAPQTLTDGTAAPDVPATSTSPSVQITGLPFDQDVQVSVFAVGANGAVSAPVSGPVHTLAQVDGTAPLPGTLSLVANTKSVNGCTLLYTADPSATDIRRIWLREARGTATPPATVTSGRPANSGTSIPNNSGTGLAVDVDPVSLTATIVINDFAGQTSTNFAFAAFPEDTSGNVNTAAPTTNGTHVFTPSSAPTTGQGAYGLIPQTATQTLHVDPATLTTATLGTIFSMDQGWSHVDQGPSAKSNWAVIDDPITAGRKIIRLSGQWITGGWYNSTLKSFDSTRTQGVTDGSGRYGARGNVKNQNKLYGCIEIKCRTAAPYAAYWKSGNGMCWPLTGWPQDELDWREGYAHGLTYANMHYYPGGTKSAGTQIQVPITIDESIDQTITFVWEKPTATDPSRMRLWYTQAGVDLGSGIGAPHLVFDTGVPSQNIAPTPAGTSATKINYLLSNPETWYCGFSLAYTGGGNFTTSTGSQYFDIISLDLYDCN